MNDKIVTHADRAAITLLTRLLGPVQDADLNPHPEEVRAAAALLERASAAAEADQPPLPEGWVLLRYSDGSHGVWWYSGRGDVLTRYDNGTGGIISVEDVRKDLTPLRPAVTEADVEKAARAGHYAEYTAAWDALHVETREAYKRQVRAAFKAARIEVRDDS